MDPVAFLGDKLKGFEKSREEFVKGVLHWRDNWNRRNPVEILKRLQREAFSDLMKLRDRQEKVERMLSFYKSTKGSPFQEANTRVKGEIDVVGALLLLDNIDQQSCDTLSRAGISTGTASRFTFETTIRQKDALTAEFVANQNDQGHYGDVIGGPLSLTKVTYLANVSDWFSAVVIPVGAQCKDVAIATNSLEQERSLTDFSPFVGSPILGQFHSAAAAAAGLMVKRSNVTAALAEFVSGVGMQQQPNSIGIRRCFSTFGQVICQISKGTKLTLLGLHKRISRPHQQIPLHSLTVPVGSFRRHNAGPSYSSSADTSFPMAAMTRNNAEDGNTGGGSIALMVESELDESTRIGGWVELQNSNPRYLKWAVTMSDTPEDELVGWGLSLGGGGIVGSEGHSSTWDQHFQVEAFLKLNMLSGNRFSLQPGLVYVMDGTTRIPALMLRSSWSL